MSGAEGVLIHPRSGAPLRPTWAPGVPRPTGVLEGDGGAIPVVRGIAVFREECGGPELLAAARRRDEREALEIFLVRSGIPPRRHARWRAFLRREAPARGAWPPRWAVGGDYGAYLRYRGAVPNFPAVLGVLSCLNRSGDRGGRLLDIGCGAAHFAPYLTRFYRPDRVTLADRDPVALLLASQVVAPETLLCLVDVGTVWPFAAAAFVDVTAFNVLSYVGDRPAVVARVRGSLASNGTAWLTTNWNPRLTDRFTGAGWDPCEAARALGADAETRLFPESVFARSVLDGVPVNLDVRYVPEEDHPDWRCFTIAVSRGGWSEAGLCPPLNMVPAVDRLRVNSMYRYIWPGWLLRRRVRFRLWEEHRRYFGLRLPSVVTLPWRRRRRDPELLRALARDLICLESETGIRLGR